jgi:hypothetical protein
MRIAVDDDGAANELRITAEVRRPETMCEDDDVRSPGTVLVGRERASEERRGAKDVEVIGADVNALHLLRAVTAANVHARTGEIVGRHCLERRRWLPCEILRNRNRASATGGILPARRDEAIGIRIGQWPQQDVVDHRKNRGVGANAERERGNRHQTEPRILDEDANGLTEMGHSEKGESRSLSLLRIARNGSSTYLPSARPLTVTSRLWLTRMP